MRDERCASSRGPPDARLRSWGRARASARPLTSPVVKRPADVGSDFDGYVRRWRKENYGLETGHGAQGVVIDPERADRATPGRQVGRHRPPPRMYRALVARFAVPSGPLNVLEIGAGGGRSTAVMLDALGDRCGDYHVVDVWAAFIEVLQQRIDQPVVVHLVDDIDLSGLPSDHFDICSPSRPGRTSTCTTSTATSTGCGGSSRRRRSCSCRASSSSASATTGPGTGSAGVSIRSTTARLTVYHEFTVAALGEMLYAVALRHRVPQLERVRARRSSVGDDGGVVPLAGPITFPFNPSQRDYLLHRSSPHGQVCRPWSPNRARLRCGLERGRGARRRPESVRWPSGCPACAASCCGDAGPTGARMHGSS